MGCEYRASLEVSERSRRKKAFVSCNFFALTYGGLGIIYYSEAVYSIITSDVLRTFACVARLTCWGFLLYCRFCLLYHVKGFAYVEMKSLESLPLVLQLNDRVPDFQRFPVMVKASEAEKNYLAKQASLLSPTKDQTSPECLVL